MKKIRRKNKTNPYSGTSSSAPSRSHSFDENSDSNQIKKYYYQHHPATTSPQQGKSIMCNQNQFAGSKSNVKFPSAQNMDTLIAIPALEDRIRANSDGDNNDEKKQAVQEEENVPNDVPLPDKGRSFKNLFKKRGGKSSSRSGTPEPMSGDELVGSSTPPPFSRDNTWNSQDDKSFFTNHSRDFGMYYNIPGKLIKGGYNKFMSSQSNLKQSTHQHNSSTQAKYLARKIFTNLVGDQRETVVESDFYPFFKSTKEAAFAFSLFDTDGSGDLTKREIRQGCIRIYKDRKNLTRSMRDLSQATGKLDIILMIIFVAVWVIVVCAAFGVDIGTGLMPLWSAFVAASFIFGTTASDAFEAIIFVFVTVSNYNNNCGLLIV